VRLYIGGSNCSQKQIWQVAKAAGMGQCNPGRLPMFNQSSLSVYHTEKYALCLSWGQPTPGDINGFVASKPGENQELIAVHCGKFGPM
jgi:hypothetical protein